MTKATNVVIVDSEWKKPRPQIDHDNEAFWAGLAEHKLLLWHCKTCGAWYWPKTYCRYHDNEPFAANMMRMAERNRLLPRHILAGRVMREIQLISGPTGKTNEEDRAED